MKEATEERRGRRNSNGEGNKGQSEEEKRHIQENERLAI